MRNSQQKGRSYSVACTEFLFYSVVKVFYVWEPGSLILQTLKLPRWKPHTPQMDQWKWWGKGYFCFYFLVARLMYSSYWKQTIVIWIVVGLAYILRYPISTLFTYLDNTFAEPLKDQLKFIRSAADWWWTIVESGWQKHCEQLRQTNCQNVWLTHKHISFSLSPPLRKKE